MKHSFVLFLIALITVGSFSGCGSINQTVAQSETKAREESIDKSKASEQAETEQQLECPRISFTNVYPEVNSQSFSAWSVKADVENECYSKLNESINQVLDKDYKDFLTNLEEEVELSEEYNTNLESGDFENVAFYTDYKTASIKRCDAQVVSIDLEQYAYSGGAHGSSTDNIYNFDTQSGQVLEFTDFGDISKEVKEYVLEYFQSDEELAQSLFEEYKDTIEKDFENNTCKLPFYLDGRGLAIVFPQYEIAPYAAGKITVTVPYGQISSFEKKYLPTEDFYTIDMQDYWADTSVDLNGDGTKEAIFLQLEYNENYEYVTGATLSVGEHTVNLGEASPHENYEGIIVHKDNQDYVFVKTSDPSDSRGLMIYDVKNEPKLLQEINAGIEQIYFDSVVLASRVDILGTYGVTREYAFGEKTGLTPISEDEDCYKFMGEPDFEDQYGHITVQKAFKDADGNEIQEGTKLYPVSTNNSGIITLTTPDNTLVKIKYELNKDKWGILIDGVEETEIFGDMLPYAG